MLEPHDLRGRPRPGRRRGERQRLVGPRAVERHRPLALVVPHQPLVDVPRALRRDRLQDLRPRHRPVRRRVPD